MNSTSSPPKRLILVDIENLAGANPRHLSSTEVIDLTTGVRRFLQIGKHDHVHVACNPAWRAHVESAWTNCHLRLRGGPDGADLELLAAARNMRLASYSSLWIVSGDHAFAPLAREARRCGSRAVVVSLPESLARLLRQSADRVIAYTPHRSPNGPR